jgi:hypothetical protein
MPFCARAEIIRPEEVSVDHCVDLNQIRAGEALTPESSTRTSVYDRIRSRRRASDKGLLPISLDDYLALLDASGRIVRPDKAGAIPDHLAPILQRLGTRRDPWPDLVTRFDPMYGLMVGAAERAAERAAQAGRHWYRGVTHLAAAFG